jgi:hypothetical protein
MYVPMFKTREVELNVISNMNECFSEKITPLIEVTREIYQKEYLLDEQGNFVKTIKEGNKKASRILLPPKEENIITLSELNKLVGDHMFFVDFFRYTTEKYGTDIKASEVVLSRKLSTDLELYYNSIVDRTADYSNIIPVISIKKGYEDDVNLIVSAINKLRKNKKAIAFRITIHLLNNYRNVIEENLTEEDYLLIDIEDTKIESVVMELDELNDYEIKANKIILNSPRPQDLKTKDFEDKTKCILINNSVAREYVKYNFIGYGDYCGYKDALPENGGGRPNSGNALALLYNFSDNSFYSFVNKDVGGQDGYTYVINEILKMKSHFDNFDICPAIKIIEKYHSNGQKGGWKQFINICFIRYLSQIYLNN